MTPHLHTHNHSCGCAHDEEGDARGAEVRIDGAALGSIRQVEPVPKKDAAGQTRTTFDVAGLCCQSEVVLIDEVLDELGGVEEYAVNIPAGTLAIYHDGEEARVEEVVEGLRKRGLSAAPRRTVGRAAAVDPNPFSARFWVIIAGVVLAAGGALFRYVLELEFASALLFAAAIAVGGFFIFRQAFSAISRRHFNIPVLVTIAVVGAGLIGEWFEAATVIILFAFAEWLEARSMARARREIGALMELAPQVAEKIEDDGTIVEVAVEEIRIGHRLRLRPGAKVPVDAVIVEGRSELDESTITGESLPVVKSVDDQVFAGTVNGSGAMTLRAVQPASKSTLARIIDAIEEARQNQSPTEQFIDRFARIYTPAVVVAAAFVALVPPLLFGALWLDWIYRSLVFLVIACPCALVISTPIANVAGLARAARQGVLVKGGKFLEILGQVTAIAFDKTGTLTRGHPRVETIEVVGDLAEDQVLLLAAQVEAQSEHHIGRAIVNAARHRFSPDQFVDRARQVEALLGQGIEAELDLSPTELQGDVEGKSSGPTRGRVGNLSWLRDCGVIVADDIQRRWEEMEGEAQTVVGIALDERLVGLVGLRDSLRPQATPALENLRRLGVTDFYVLTGDNSMTAQRIGRELGLEDQSLSARLLPAEKVARIEELRERHPMIAMVGDGVNDAPALAGATVGIAMGAAGTDVALESADVALMSDDLNRLAEAVDIGRRTTRVIRQNIAVALGLKLIFLVLAILGLATLWMAIIADMGASLIVIFNAIRLLRQDSNSAQPATGRPLPPRSPTELAPQKP